MYFVGKSSFTFYNRLIRTPNKCQKIFNILSHLYNKVLHIYVNKHPSKAGAGRCSSKIAVPKL